jgi:hypothetical protein
MHYKMRIIDTINFVLTTHCNMSCPDCCVGLASMEKVNRRFFDLDYIENAAKYFKGMRKINITGGEPTIHPLFNELAPKLKSIFECEVLSLQTNGTMISKKLEALKHFDIIYITKYDANTFVGSPDNAEQIQVALDNLGSRINPIHPLVHTTMETKKGNNPCFRLDIETVEFNDGRIYPCCCGSGLETKINLPLSYDWQDKIRALIPPCHECVFGQE